MSDPIFNIKKSVDLHTVEIMQLQRDLGMEQQLRVDLADRLQSSMEKNRVFVEACIRSGINALSSEVKKAKWGLSARVFWPTITGLSLVTGLLFVICYIQIADLRRVITKTDVSRISQLTGKN